MRMALNLESNPEKIKGKIKTEVPKKKIKKKKILARTPFKLAA